MKVHLEKKSDGVRVHLEKNRWGESSPEDFDENVHTMAMIQHSMTIVKEGVAYVNHNQTPVIAMDQPLFAIAK